MFDVRIIAGCYNIHVNKHIDLDSCEKRAKPWVQKMQHGIIPNQGGVFVRQTAPLPTASALTGRNQRNARCARPVLDVLASKISQNTNQSGGLPGSQTGLTGKPPLHALDCVPGPMPHESFQQSESSRETALNAGNEVFYNTTAVAELLASAAHSEKLRISGQHMVCSKSQALSLAGVRFKTPNTASTPARRLQRRECLEKPCLFVDPSGTGL